MSLPVIRAENLGKQYQLGVRRRGYQTLREAIVQALAAPLRRFRELSGKADDRQKFWALRDVCFEIHPGDSLAIIGRNGAGKSTLLKILSRITEPTAGRAEIRGRMGSLLEVGTGFHPELTGRENIFLNGAILGMKQAEIRRKFDEIVDFAGVEPFLDTPVKRYSSGMYVRLAFSVAAHLDPEILVVDEVLAVGDAAFQKKCLGKMGSVARGGRTVLFVSHSMDAVRRLCRMGLWLNDGRVHYHGPVEDCVTRYLTAGLQGGARREFAPPLPLPNRMGLSLLAVQVANAAGRLQAHFSANDPIHVTIDWELAQRLYKPRLGFILQSLGGGEVFTALDAESWSRPWLEAGRYRSTCVIPGRLLNEGNYALDFSGDVPNRFGFREGLSGPLLEFDVEDDMTLPNRYYGEEGFRDARWPGVVLPHITWKQEQLETQSNVDAGGT